MPAQPLQDPVQLLADRFKAGIATAFPQLGADVDPLITASKQAELGDFQSNAAMSLAKRLSMKPRDVAEKIVASVDLGDIAEPLTPAAIAEPELHQYPSPPQGPRGPAHTTGQPEPGNPARRAARDGRRVDLMGVNLAKQMHVGHLRDPIIGDALARTFERQGHKVIRQNHVGDWGLPIAMVTAELLAKMSEAGAPINLDKLTLDDLDNAYRSSQPQAASGTPPRLEAVHKYGAGA